MAEHGEIAGWMAAALAFLGALGAAMKFWNKPASAPEKDVLMQLVMELERRQNAMDERFSDVFELLGGVKDSLSQVQADVREALTRLQERRK